MPGTERKRRELKRGRIYDVRGVETLSVVEDTLRGVRIVYTGKFDIDMDSGVKSGQTKKLE